MGGWTWLETAKLLVSLITPLVVAVVGYLIALRLKWQEERSQAARDLQQEEREFNRHEREAQIERKRSPHIELRIAVDFFGHRNGLWLTCISVVSSNLGQIIHKFNKINLRVRGIKDEPFEFWNATPPHPYFPHKILETNMVPKDWSFIFIEPGVEQKITLPTLIPVQYSYLLVNVEFEYREFWPHTAQEVFAVPMPDIEPFTQLGSVRYASEEDLLSSAGD